MEAKIPRGDSKRSIEAKKPPSRLQKQAPSSLQLDPAASAAAWDGSRAPIPLLSPLILSPAPLPDAAGERESKAGGGGGGGGGDEKERRPSPTPTPPKSGGGWRHPALPMVVMEPAAILPFFQSQCAL